MFEQRRGGGGAELEAKLATDLKAAEERGGALRKINALDAIVIAFLKRVTKANCSVQLVLATNR